jgi:hypothetical protein
VPCLNEELTVGTVVRSFRDALPRARVYVYDNNSTDRTAEVAAKEGAIVRRSPLAGKGNVVRQMFADIDADVYLLVDGDDTYDPTAAGALVDLVLGDGYDVVQGHRVPVDRHAYRRGHVFGNAVLTGLARALFGRSVPDMLSGYLALSRRFVKSFPCEATGFEVEAEITVSALEMSIPIAEVPCAYRSRPAGSSSKLTALRDGLVIIATMARLVRQGRPLLFFGMLALVLTALALALGVPILETFLQIHKVPRFPTAILATGLVMLAALSLMSGLILDTVTRGRREARRLRYLSLSGPLTHYPSIPVSDDLPINEATPWVQKGTPSAPSDPH